jgi:hypothetical protein
MRCEKCNSNKFERIIMPAFPSIQVSKFVEPKIRADPIEKIKCLKCGTEIK